jgi:hypothetical protein
MNSSSFAGAGRADTLRHVRFAQAKLCASAARSGTRGSRRTVA